MLYNPRAASYDLARPVTKGIVNRVPPDTPLCSNTEELGTAVGLLALRRRLLEPILSGLRTLKRAKRIMPPNLGHRAVTSTVV